LIAGILVGGAAVRMGGRAKGRLVAPSGEAIVERWRAILQHAVGKVLLVGSAEAYASLDLEAIADDPPGIGPLGGLVALLRRAGNEPSLAVACDMPYVSRGLVERLASSPQTAPVIAPRLQGRWEPLFARYDSPRVLPIATSLAAGKAHSLQRLLDTAGAAELPLGPGEDEQLRDWDIPVDLPRG
jgi:molybdopterin-guanine dinucleotide biosynthesis protein A